LITASIVGSFEPQSQEIKITIKIGSSRLFSQEVRFRPHLNLDFKLGVCYPFQLFGDDGSRLSAAHRNLMAGGVEWQKEKNIAGNAPRRKPRHRR
jgi:hypothetical protein